MTAESRGAALGKPHEKRRSGRCLSDFAVYGILKVLPPPNRQREGVRPMKEIISFLISVAASVVAYYICKWLDGEI